MVTTRFYAFSQKCDNLPNLWLIFKVTSNLPKFCSVEFKIYASCNFTKFERNQMYCSEKNCAQNVPLKSVCLFVFSLPWQQWIQQHFFSQNMQSFIQALTPTKFEVHGISTLENHIFKFSLPNRLLWRCHYGIKLWVNSREDFVHGYSL